MVKITAKSVDNAIKALIQAGEFTEDFKRNATNSKKIAALILGEDKDGKQIKPTKADIALAYEYVKPPEEESLEGDDDGEDEGKGGGAVREHYKTKYAKESETKTGCGDEFDVAFRTYC